MGIDVPIPIVLVFSPRPREVVEIPLTVEQGCTVEQALALTWERIDAGMQGVPPAGQGVWGKKVGLAHVLRAHDRLEIYRALTVDPKVARRQRFQRQGAKKAAGLFAKRREGAKAGY